MVAFKFNDLGKKSTKVKMLFLFKKNKKTSYKKVVVVENLKIKKLEKQAEIRLFSFDYNFFEK